MAFLSSFNISASGMTAQRMRLDVVSENIANMNTTRTENGGPYTRKMVVFQAIDSEDSFKSQLNQAMKFSSSSNQKGGVNVIEVVEDEAEFKPTYDPSHPDADENGYVMMPNVELLKETIDSMSATRSYDANVTAFNAMKSMALKALEIGQ